LFQAAAARSADARGQEVTSVDLASAAIPDFKKQDPSFEVIHSGLMSPANLNPGLEFTLPQTIRLRHLHSTGAYRGKLQHEETISVAV
jgi:hypothetical protein